MTNLGDALLWTDQEVMRLHPITKSERASYLLKKGRVLEAVALLDGVDFSTQRKVKTAHLDYCQK